MKRLYLLLICLITLGIFSSKATTKYLGGDISLLTKYEEKGAIYYNENGVRITNMLGYLRATGMNAMRVRLFVDPSKANAEDQGEGVCQDLPYVLALGKRIKDAGFDLLLDIHYSDTWTDPGQHSTPSSWTVTTALADSVYGYTKRVLHAMMNAGATPDLIQVGNEVTYGMLWPTGHCYPNGGDNNGGTFQQFATYLMQGIRACREVCPDAKVVVHTEMSRSTNVTSFYRTLAGYTSDFDVIGLSYYPYWHGDLNVLDALLTELENSYPGKQIQIVETGYPHAYYPSGASYDLQSVWPATEAGQKAFTTALVAMLNGHSHVNGLFWWFPEANEYGINYTNHVTTDWYNCGWWDNSNGQVMDALFETLAFVDDDEPEPIETPSYYIVGGVGNWSLTEPIGRMSHQGNGIYVDTLTISDPIYFVFADGSPEQWNDDWPTFNSSYRYGPTATTTVLTSTQYYTAKRNNNYSYYFMGDGSDYVFTFDTNTLSFIIERIEPQTTALLGDVNSDGQVNISDASLYINYVLGNQILDFNFSNADLNQDGKYNITDVTMLIVIITTQ